MRGKRFYKLITAASGRITPAHAGKTVPPIVKSRHNKDHPRACGENNPPLRFIVVYLGSPPRMRGKRKDPLTVYSRHRITPAHAGKTYEDVTFNNIAEDHPRACGENLSIHPFHLQYLGSPPRMRGKHDDNIKSVVTQRITPAHAGKTICNLRLCKITKDHPRACGENCQPVTASLWITGSPPRMRGKLICWALTHAASGITPAHAGKTFSSSCFFKLVQDHPRACGENTAYKSSSSYHLGSPPRMRGKPA